MFFLEPGRANDNRIALGWTETPIFVFLVTLEGTHAASFPARGVALLEWTWWSFTIHLQGFYRQSTTLIG